MGEKKIKMVLKTGLVNILILLIVQYPACTSILGKSGT